MSTSLTLIDPPPPEKYVWKNLYQVFSFGLDTGVFFDWQEPAVFRHLSIRGWRSALATKKMQHAF